MTHNQGHPEQQPNPAHDPEPFDESTGPTPDKNYAFKSEWYGPPGMSGSQGVTSGYLSLALTPPPEATEPPVDPKLTVTDFEELPTDGTLRLTIDTALPYVGLLHASTVAKILQQYLSTIRIPVSELTPRD